MIADGMDERTFDTCRKLARLFTRKVPYYIREDAEQEAWVGMLAAVGRYDPCRSLTQTFLQFRARGAVLSFLRRETCFSRSSLTAPEVIDLRLVQDRLGIEPTQERSVERFMMRRWINRLGRKQRAAVRSRLADETLDEYANRQGISKIDATKHYHMAVRRLRKFMVGK